MYQAKIYGIGNTWEGRGEGSYEALVDALGKTGADHVCDFLDAGYYRQTPWFANVSKINSTDTGSTIVELEKV